MSEFCASATVMRSHRRLACRSEPSSTCRWRMVSVWMQIWNCFTTSIVILKYASTIKFAISLRIFFLSPSSSISRETVPKLIEGCIQFFHCSDNSLAGFPLHLPISRLSTIGRDDCGRATAPLSSAAWHWHGVSLHQQAQRRRQAQARVAGTAQGLQRNDAPARRVPAADREVGHDRGEATGRTVEAQRRPGSAEALLEGLATIRAKEQSAGHKRKLPHFVT